MNNFSSISENKQTLDTLIKDAYLNDDVSISDLAKAAALPTGQIKKIIGANNLREGVNAQNVRAILDKLETIQPTRFTTYATIALIAGKSSNSARAVGQALLARNAVTSSQAAHVLRDRWFSPALNAYVLPKEESTWYDREGLGRTRYDVLREEGAKFNVLDDGYISIPNDLVITTVLSFTQHIESMKNHKKQ